MSWSSWTKRASWMLRYRSVFKDQVWTSLHLTGNQRVKNF